MDIPTFEAAFVLAASILPGYIIDKIFLRFFTRNKDAENITVLRYLIYSALFLAAMSPVFYFTGDMDFRWLSMGEKALILTLVLVLIPALFAVGIAVFLWSSATLPARSMIKRIMTLLGLRPLSTSPSSWDHVFGAGQHYWLLITLTDGSRVAGFYTTGSHASSSTEGGDLYVSQVWRVQSGGKPWVRAQPPSSILLDRAQIKYIEFW